MRSSISPRHPSARSQSTQLGILLSTLALAACVGREPPETLTSTLPADPTAEMPLDQGEVRDPRNGARTGRRSPRATPSA